MIDRDVRVQVSRSSALPSRFMRYESRPMCSRIGLRNWADLHFQVSLFHRCSLRGAARRYESYVRSVS